MEKQRIVYLDIVRIVACILVVMVHVVAYQTEYYDITGTNYVITNAFHILSFSGVSLFVMISGALALQPAKDTTLKNVLWKKVCYFFLLYYLWKFIYQIVAMVEKGIAFTPDNIKEELVLALVKQRGYYHLWYLPMIAVLYMIVPLIKKGMEEKKTCQYFLCVFFVTALLFPTLFLYEFKFKYLFVSFFEANDFYFFGGYLGYFVLGHYLHNWKEEMTPKKRRLLLILGVAGFLLACVLGTLASREAGEPDYRMQTPFVVTHFFTSVSLFCALQEVGDKIENKEKITHVIKRVSGLTLGIYLLHPVVLNLLLNWGFDRIWKIPLLAIPIVLSCTVVLTGIIAAMIKKIPGIRKIV